MHFMVARVPAGVRVGKEDTVPAMFQFFRRSNVRYANEKGPMVLNLLTDSEEEVERKRGAPTDILKA